MLVIDWHTFGERVHVARRRLKLSQAVLAERVGISRNYASMIERGIADPSYAIVISMCAYLGIQPPGEKILAALNLEAVVMYQEKKQWMPDKHEN